MYMSKESWQSDTTRTLPRHLTYMNARDSTPRSARNVFTRAGVLPT